MIEQLKTKKSLLRTCDSLQPCFLRVGLFPVPATWIAAAGKPRLSCCLSRRPSLPVPGRSRWHKALAVFLHHPQNIACLWAFSSPHSQVRKWAQTQKAVSCFSSAVEAQEQSNHSCCASKTWSFAHKQCRNHRCEAWRLLCNDEALAQHQHALPSPWGRPSCSGCCLRGRSVTARDERVLFKADTPQQSAQLQPPLAPHHDSA